MQRARGCRRGRLACGNLALGGELVDDRRQQRCQCRAGLARGHPALLANWESTSPPSTCDTCWVEIGGFGPVEIQEDIMSPRPACWNWADEAAQAVAAAHRGVPAAQQGQHRGHRLWVLLHELGHAARLLHEVFEHSHEISSSASDRSTAAARVRMLHRVAEGRRYSSTRSTARKASCGMSTVPTRFIRFLPSFCFSRSLRLRRDVAAVALGDHVLAQGLHGFAGDDARADGGLDGDLEHLPGDHLPHLLHERLAPARRRCRGGR